MEALCRALQSERASLTKSLKTIEDRLMRHFGDAAGKILLDAGSFDETIPSKIEISAQSNEQKTLSNTIRSNEFKDKKIFSSTYRSRRFLAAQRFNYEQNRNQIDGYEDEFSDEDLKSKLIEKKKMLKSNNSGLDWPAGKSSGFRPVKGGVEWFKGNQFGFIKSKDVKRSCIDIESDEDDEIEEDGSDENYDEVDVDSEVLEEHPYI